MSVKLSTPQLMCFVNDFHDTHIEKLWNIVMFDAMTDYQNHGIPPLTDSHWDVPTSHPKQESGSHKVQQRKLSGRLEEPGGCWIRSV